MDRAMEDYIARSKTDEGMIIYAEVSSLWKHHDEFPVTFEDPGFSVEYADIAKIRATINRPRNEITIVVDPLCGDITSCGSSVCYMNKDAIPGAIVTALESGIRYCREKFNRQILKNSDGQTCPECGAIVGPRGNRYDGYEGSFYHCPECGKVSILFREGSNFTIGIPMRACTVYQITAISKSPDMITCIQVANVNASRLAKVDMHHYYYFNRATVVAAMRRHYREGLV